MFSIESVKSSAIFNNLLVVIFEIGQLGKKFKVVAHYHNRRMSKQNHLSVNGMFELIKLGCLFLKMWMIKFESSNIVYRNEANGYVPGIKRFKNFLSLNLCTVMFLGPFLRCPEQYLLLSIADVLLPKDYGTFYEKDIGTVRNLPHQIYS